jgi:hypothetical protein
VAHSVLSDGPSDVLSECDDDNVDSKSYTDFESEIARKIKKTVHHLHTDSESGSAKKQDSDDKSMIYATEGTVTWQKQDIIAKVKISGGGGDSGVKKKPTYCISVSGGPPGDIDKHMLQKIIGDGQGKQKCPARKCRAQKKMGETRQCANLLCLVPPHKGESIL